MQRLATVGIQRPCKESDGVVHFFGLDEEHLGNGDHGLARYCELVVGLLLLLFASATL